MTWPVTNPASSEARNATTPAVSVGSPIRPRANAELAAVFCFGCYLSERTGHRAGDAGGDVHHPPAVGQRARRRPHHQERSAGVDGHQTVEILHRGLRH